MYNFHVVAQDRENIVLRIAAALAHQIAPELAFSQQQVASLFAADRTMKVALTSGFLWRQWILQHDYGSVEFIT